MSTDLDPLGFTRQTEMVLRSVGAQDLLKEFKNRNISTVQLHRLTKEDLVILGADENQAKHIINALCISKKHKSGVKPKSYQRISEKMDQMLQQEEIHLHVIIDYLKYCRLRLNKERINCFVEADEALSASKILCIAADVTLKEITNTELKLKELEAVILIKPQRKRYSLVLYCISLGSLCVGVCILSKFWK